MTRAFQCLVVVAVLAGAAFGQSAFEAADVHASPKTKQPYPRGPFIHSGIYELRTATMVDLIRMAYGVAADKVLDGPNWLEMDLFDITARLPENSTPETRKAMLQALLADRFKLVVHRDNKPVPAFQLTAGKHRLLKKTEGPGEDGCKFTRPDQPPQGVQALPTYIYSCHNITMAAFAAGLDNMNGTCQYINDETVVDKTGLQGAWDFNFKYTNRGAYLAATGDTITIFDAIDKQLGLKLEPGKVSLPVVVVDSVNQKPSENLPDIEEVLRVPPPPTDFEVADVKPANPDFRGTRFQISPGGKVNIQGATLKSMIENVWDIRDEMLAGAPKWLDTDRFDIVAKAPSTGEEIDNDAVWEMVKTLLAERFKLAVHTEERPAPAYTLIAVKPKLKKADPASRTLYREGPAIANENKDPRNTNPALSRLVTCQNMTMAQFAERLQGMAPGYIHSPVLDATGIEGGYDFMLSWSPVGLFQPGGGRGGETAGQASDPNGGITLLEAIEKQLGLKLEMQKRLVPVLVIDHVEQKPTDN